MTTIAIIGGSGLSRIEGLKIIERKQLQTPFGMPSADYIIGQLNGTTLVFLARHGNPHTIPPHRINYRANLWGLKQLAVEQIIAVAAVGGISSEMPPAKIAIPEQIIDYTYGRNHTFFEDGQEQVTHIDFTYPYTQHLRHRLIESAEKSAIHICPRGVYGATQGPRLETAAEIHRMERDGCDLVGMTGMPEAALARELGMDYASLSVVANWAAGKTEGEITMPEIEQNLHQGMADAIKILQFICQD